MEFANPYYSPPNVLAFSISLKPVIMVYAGEEGSGPCDKFTDFIAASFHIGLECGEPEGSGNVKFVRTEMYSSSEPDGEGKLKSFVDLLLDHGINHEVKFFTEPLPAEQSNPLAHGLGEEETPDPSFGRLGEMEYEEEMKRLKEMRRKGELTKKEFKARRGELLERRQKDVSE